MNNYANNVAYKKPFHQSSLKSVFSALFGGVAFLLFILFIFMGDDVDLLSKEGASTVLYAVLPSTFPYLVLSGILLESAFPYYLGKAMAPLTNFLKLSPLSAVALFAAPISGFPLPSSIAWELFEQGEISEEECSRISDRKSVV